MAARRRTLAAAVKGDRRQALEALRDRLAVEIDTSPPPRDLAALSRQLAAVLAELDALPSAVKESDPADDLAARRAARRSTASG